MEQKQDAELVFRRVRVIDETGMVSLVNKPLPVGKKRMATGDTGSTQHVDALRGEVTLVR